MNGHRFLVLLWVTIEEPVDSTYIADVAGRLFRAAAADTMFVPDVNVDGFDYRDAVPR